MSIGSPSQGDSDTNRGPREIKDRTVAAAVLRILGNQVLHHITGGQMMIVESVLSGTYYGWSQMMLVSLK